MHILIRVLLLLVFAFAMADCWTTNKALSLGGKEANPVMAFFMRLLGSKWVLARLAFALATVWAVARQPDGVAPVIALGANCALMTWVIWNNLGVIKVQSK